METVLVYLISILILGVVIFWIYLNFSSPRAQESAVGASNLNQPTALGQNSENGSQSVVGQIVPANTVSPEFVSSGEISFGDPDLEPPVGTFLIEESPLEVQSELIALAPDVPFTGIEVPESFDAREKWPNLISEAYHQGLCGSCWAFSVALAASDRIRIANPNDQELRKKFFYRPFVPRENNQRVQYPVINNLSPYQLVDCDTCKINLAVAPNTVSYLSGSDQICDNACYGGYLQTAYNYLKMKGVPSLLSSPTACDPLNRNCPCREREGVKYYQIKRTYSLVSPGESKEQRRRSIMEDLYRNGPISIGVKIYQSFYDFFRENPTGVYSNLVRPRNDRPIGGHALVIVGWGTDQNGTFYWICRNSWGPAWGDKGFCKIQYDFEGILQNAVAAEV